MASPMIALKGPLMDKKDYTTNFPLKHAQKDMRFALALGDKVILYKVFIRCVLLEAGGGYIGFIGYVGCTLVKVRAGIVGATRVNRFWYTPKENEKLSGPRIFRPFDHGEEQGGPLREGG